MSIQKLKELGPSKYFEEVFFWSCCSAREHEGMSSMEPEPQRTSLSFEPGPRGPPTAPTTTGAAAPRAPVERPTAPPPQTSAVHQSVSAPAPPAPPPETLMQAKAERMREGHERLRSFANWPHSAAVLPLCTPERLAGSGFFLDADEQFKDRVSCAFCHLSLGDWKPEHDPVEAHLSLSPNCPLVVQFGVLSKQNIRTAELVDGSWRVVDCQDCEVAVPVETVEQNVVISRCVKTGTGSMLVIVQGPAATVVVEQCRGAIVSILGGARNVRISGCEEVEVISEQATSFSIENTHGARVEAQGAALDTLRCVTTTSSAVVLQTVLGAEVIVPPLGIGAAPTGAKITQCHNGYITTRDG